jgi:hypothetical protein
VQPLDARRYNWPGAFMLLKCDLILETARGSGPGG